MTDRDKRYLRLFGFTLLAMAIGLWMGVFVIAPERVVYRDVLIEAKGWEETCIVGQATFKAGQIGTIIAIGERVLCGKDITISNIQAPVVKDFDRLQFHSYLLED